MYNQPQEWVDSLPNLVPAHIIAQVKFRKTDRYVSVDLADLKEPTYFKPFNGKVAWDEPALFHPDDLLLRPFKWRRILEVYPKLIEVRQREL